MKGYKVFIEINGSMILVGNLQGKDYSDTRFSYDTDYLNRENARPISISLPLCDEPFSLLATRNFFEALLPEGFTRQALANSLRKDESDYLGILSVVGRECIGAMMICEEQTESQNRYIPITQETIKALAAEGATKSAEILGKTHLSLAGASGKVGLYLDEQTGEWFLPEGLAPSTHIVKQSHVRYSDIVINEALCMKIARRCGIDVPDSFIMDTGGKTDRDILFVTKRFDRYVEGRMVHRLHQEDFSQALSIPSRNKYEPDGENYLAQMFNTIKNYCANPIEDQIKLFRMIAFNILVGNTDAHLKNYSLVYDKALGSRKLSPAYDILCTTYHGTSNALSFNINGKYNIASIGYSDLLNAAKDCGMGQKIAGTIIDDLCECFEQSVKECAYELADQGYSNAQKIAESMLKNSLFP